MDACRAAPGATDFSPWVTAYRPLPGVFDEMVDGAGRLRPHWRSFLTLLAGLGPEEINRRFAAADRHLHDSGVFYRVYEDPAGVERPWPLSHVPLLIDAVVADAYGPARMVREGWLPAAVIAGNSEFIRPLVGVAPPGGAYLWLYA